MFDVGRPSGLRIILALSHALARRRLRRTVEGRFCHRVVGEAGTGTDMIRVCLMMDADLVVFDADLPRMNGLGALAEVRRVRNVAALALIEDRAGGAAGIELDEVPYLLKPVDAEQLQAAMLSAKAQVDQEHRLEKTIHSFRDALEQRGVIEEAKGLLMRRYGLSEPDAHRRLQRTSMNRRLPMIKVAKEVLATGSSPALAGTHPAHVRRARTPAWQVTVR